MRFGEDNPTRFLMRRLYAAVLPDHPYGRPVIGEPHVIQRLTREQLLGFYRRYYVPEAFTLVVVGAVDHDVILPAPARPLGHLPRIPAPRPPAPPVTETPNGRIEVTRPTSHAYLALGWLA